LTPVSAGVFGVLGVAKYLIAGFLPALAYLIIADFFEKRANHLFVFVIAFFWHYSRYEIKSYKSIFQAVLDVLRAYLYKAFE
jgi:hypothetical protein